MKDAFTQDSMRFVLDKPKSSPQHPSLGFRDLWVGDLPEEAQDLVDLLVSSYEHPDIAVPKGFVKTDFF
jgi:hypothetical protein